jgi:uncharacterized protein YndB with AHSA1/START domain
MPHSFTLTAVIPASPQQIYEAWLDSAAHSAMTGGVAIMSTKVDAEVSAWDGYITGTNLELTPGRRIVQSWRTTTFANHHEDSTVTLKLAPVAGGTQLTLVHSNVPDGQTSYQQGWVTHYFEPMRKYFSKPRSQPAPAVKSAKAPHVKAKVKVKPISKTKPAAPKKARPRARR